jgi:lysophospholipase L1-like esterase
MTLSSCHRLFGVFAIGALALVSPASLISASAQAASAQPAAAPPSADVKPVADAKPADAKPVADAKPDTKTDAKPADQAAAPQQPASPEQKGMAATAIDKMKQVAKSASDIFSRVPCLPPKGGVQSMGSLPHVATKLATGRPVVIIAFGSSSTQGWGSSSPEFSYPSRLAAQLKRKYPTADITVINSGRGGEDAPEMMKRLQTSVIDVNPDLVIWQVGTNAVLRNLDPDETANLVEDGVSRIQAAGSDVVLVDPQYSPRVTEHPDSASRIINLLHHVASLRHIGIFPRFAVMRDWHEKQALPINDFVIADGLHMNDWGYACFAQLLGDDIIKSVGQIRLGVNVPSEVRTYRPM